MTNNTRTKFNMLKEDKTKKEHVHFYHSLLTDSQNFHYAIYIERNIEFYTVNHNSHLLSQS